MNQRTVRVLTVCLTYFLASTIFLNALCSDIQSHFIPLQDKFDEAAFLALKLLLLLFYYIN